MLLLHVMCDVHEDEDDVQREVGEQHDDTDVGKEIGVRSRRVGVI